MRKQFESFEKELEEDDDDDDNQRAPAAKSKKKKHKSLKPDGHTDGKKVGDQYKMKMDFRCGGNYLVFFVGSLDSVHRNFSICIVMLISLAGLNIAVHSRTGSQDH